VREREVRIEGERWGVREREREGESWECGRAREGEREYVRERGQERGNK